MPLVRVVADNLESTRELIAELCLLGFQVELAKPGSAASNCANLQIDLRLCTSEVALERAREFLHGSATQEVAFGVADREADQLVLPGLSYEPADGQPGDEEKLSDWPLWHPLEGIAATNEPFAARSSAFANAADVRLTRRWSSVPKPVFAAVALLAVVAGSFILQHYRHSAKPTNAEGVGIEARSAEAVTMTGASVKPAAIKEAVLSDRGSSLRHQESGDDIVAPDTVVRYTRGGAASDRKPATPMQRRNYGSDYVAEDTVVRYGR
jgi:hypothetical protein